MDKSGQIASQGLPISSWSTSQLNKSAWILAIFQLALLVIFIFTTEDSSIGKKNTEKDPIVGYSMFSGVEIMMFIGFGYLMTFMKWYGVSALGFTMIVTAIGLQWAVLTEGFFDMTVSGVWSVIEVDIYSFLNALYAISAVLITYGALIGKISPVQLVVVTIVELAIHSVNYKVILGSLHVADMGGTYIDHMFGAYFGLAVSYMLGKPKHEPAGGNVPDLFSLIGTLFLWVYWPSFVAGAAEPGSKQQQSAIVHTILALSSSTVTTFFLSSVLGKSGKFRPVDVQNATLAGGVSIGCVANWSIHPAGAILIGIVAAAVSTYGFNTIQPALEAAGLHDTCGIHNLHAMPSIVGAVASIIASAALKSEDAKIFGEFADSQWWRQLVGMLATTSFAIATGLITGKVCQLFKGADSASESAAEDFQDNLWWEVAADYAGGAAPHTHVATEVNALITYSKLNIAEQSDVEMTPAKSSEMPTTA